jgi:argininosuccinate lyase
MFGDAARTVTLVSAAMGTAKFDVATLESRAAEGWTTFTELADTLVREHSLSFKKAHAVAAGVAALAATNPRQPLAPLLAEASRELLGASIVYTEEELAAILSPRRFVTVRRTLGGPAPEETGQALTAASRQLQTDAAWLTAADRAHACAEAALGDRAARL